MRKESFIRRCGKRVRFILGILTLLWLFIPNAYAQSPDEDQLWAKWINNLIPYLKWPVAHNPLVVCTVGRGHVDEFLRASIKTEEAAAARQGKKLTPIQVMPQTMKSSFKDCNVLYVSISETDVVENIIDKLNDRPVVTVSAIPSFALRGGMIEFMRQDGKPFRINSKQIYQTGVTINADLLAISENVGN